MKRLFISGWLALFILPAFSQLTVFEKTNGAETPTYQETIAFFKGLDAQSPKLLMKTMGMTDAGLPLHLVLFSNDAQFNPAAWHRQNKVVILVNNGIHPGEPDGIDASLLLVRDLVSGQKKIADNVALAFIPVYNIGGCLNRSSNYRVNQNGPLAFGSRGNSQNLDLNRDFIKSDTKEARSFAGIFHWLDPDIFIDNHVSNGADYQHVMTLIASQHNKLGGAMGQFMHTTFEPALYQLMRLKGYDLVPYVNAFSETPETGWPQFLEGPRFSSGYATLWHSFAFVPETHMLKPYAQRVDATYRMMESFIDFATAHDTIIKRLRRQTKQQTQTQLQFPVSWRLNKSQFSEITFKGFEAAYKPSTISGLPRLFYDRSKPYEKKVPFYNTYVTGVSVQKPTAYIIPQGWWKVVELLQTNEVTMRALKNDTTILVEVYRIEQYKTSAQPHESHHINSDVMLSTIQQTMHFRKGDWYIPMNQVANRFITEVLEPQSEDSYFAWNFFDGILGQKEGFSAYVFEDTAEAFLKTHPEIRAQLAQRKAFDSAFANNAAAQLDFIYKRSPYYEPDHLRYPVYRVR